MLEIDMEFRKGILFVRLIGSLIKNTVPILDKEVTRIVRDYGIHNVVFNVSSLKEIDSDGIEALLKYYELATITQGKTFVCGVSDSKLKKKMRQGRIFQYLYEMSDELSVIHEFE